MVRKIPRVSIRVSVGQKRYDIEIDPLQAGGGALEVSVIDGQHHGAAGRGVEDARQAVLHPPVELMRAFEIKARRLLRPVG